MILQNERPRSSQNLDRTLYFVCQGFSWFWWEQGTRWTHHLWKVNIITFWVLEIDQLIFCTNNAYPKWSPDLDTSIRDIEMKIWIMCANFLLLENLLRDFFYYKTCRNFEPFWPVWVAYICPQSTQNIFMKTCRFGFIQGASEPPCS